MVPIISDFIPEGRENRPGLLLVPKYITIHDTANPSAGADAKSHAEYAKSNSAALKEVSWHYVVDDKVIYKCLPAHEVAWHAGDGRNGTGNRQSIAIEICVNIDGDLGKAEKNAAELTAHLMKTENITLDHVVQHNHWSNKDCPFVIRHRPNGWNDFLGMVAEYRRVNKPIDPDIRTEPDMRPDFGSVLDSLKEGYAVRRQEWDIDTKLILETPDITNSIITEPYFYLKVGTKIYKIWYPNAEELLANDWEIADEE